MPCWSVTRRRPRMCHAAEAVSGGAASRMVTAPVSPSSSMSAPLGIIRVASVTETAQGMPRSRDTMTEWLITAPTSTITPPAARKRGVHEGCVIGLFRIVRQPIYVAFTLTLWTVPTWTPDQLAVALSLTTYCLVGPLLKEKRFRRRFGQTFTVYENRVPYWLPWPRPLIHRNDLSIYDVSADWWGDKTRWLRTLQNLVPARFSFFDPIVGDWRGEAVLDLGCGGGFMAEALSKRGAKVTGIDPSEGAIAAARRHAEANDLEIDYHVASGESLPFANDVFDIVVCVDVLEHVEDLSRLLFEVRRVLRPNGVFLFDTINRTRMASFLLVTIGENVIRLLPRGTHDPSRFIPPKELARKLEAADFNVGRFVGMGPCGLNRRFDFISVCCPQWQSSTWGRQLVDHPL